MTKEEVLQEVRKDFDWIDDRYPNIYKKYKRMLKIGKQERILGITKYTTPRNNLVWVVWLKDNYGCENKVFISNSVFIEYRNYDGKINYIMPFAGLFDFVVFTGHSIERLNERAGLDWNGFLRYFYSANRFKLFENKYTYKGKEVTASALGDKGLFLIDSNGKWGRVCKTFVNTELLGSNQKESLEESVNGTQDFITQANDIWRSIVTNKLAS